MKKIIAILLICFVASTAIKAQYVNIPDANFKSFLQTKYPAAFNGAGQMDTTNSLIVNEVTIDCSNKNISDLTGISYFKHLTDFNCSNNQVASLKKLPNTLGNLDCSYNLLDSLNIPGTAILNLFCQHNHLKFISINPSISYIEQIDCSYNNLTNIDALALVAMPIIGIRFNCSYNQITGNFSMPYSSGVIVDCSHNLISSIDDGTKPYTFDCSYNLLTKAPVVVHWGTTIKYNCSHNLITQFNPYIDISNQPINSFVLQEINCSNNNIHCFGTFPPALTKLTLDANKITCLPNQPLNLKVYDSSNILISKPICNPTNNSNGCPILTVPANYVNIPDTSFGKFLLAQYPSCLYKDASNLYWMDTTCSGIVNAKVLSIGYKIIYNLSGIRYFKSLQKLYCDGNYFNSIDSLPATLKDLSCGSLPNLTLINGLPNGLRGLFMNDNPLITSLPNLPSTIDSLDFSDCSVAVCPALPNTMRYLSCYRAKLTSFTILPDSLKQLFCYQNTLTSLPAIPSTLTSLSCDKNLLTSLPLLPNSLMYLSCTDNKLISLPNFPNSLLGIYCLNNLITSISGINSSLQYLHCYNNKITSISQLPPTLIELKCSNNLLTALPDLPFSLNILSCVNNSGLHCLPYLPKPNIQLYFDTANIKCLPDSSIYLLGTIGVSTYPICNISNNPNNCQIFGASPNYVNIPDTSFGKFLLAKYPSCLYKDNANKYWMDTTCSGVVNAVTLDCSYNNINNINGVQYFDNLKTFVCANNNLTTLSTLPNGLIVLDCSVNKITSLPTLPNSLNSLDCSNDSLTSLSTLPVGLNTLHCDRNKLTNLPLLPNSLTELSCQNNNLINLPSLPNSLANLYCAYNQITNLPTLPNGLTSLDCGQNIITSLPILPNNLASLVCHFNSLISLPALPNSLSQLLCQANPLNNLPILPSSLIELDCQSNQLTNLPTLPIFLKYLYCSNNNIQCLPTLPNTLTTLYVDISKIHCLPNIPSGLSTTLSLCNPTNNPNNCTVYLPNYVNIPDTSFGKFLLTQYPSCLYKDASNLYWMDTTCSAVVNETFMWCYNLNIYNMEGVKYFKSLKTLWSYYNNVSTLPTLPNTLTSLSFYQNQLTSLSNLPSGLIDLGCSFNKITSLPLLPTNLISLGCDGNQLTNLPTLPSSLLSLSFSHNQLTVLPVLPSALYLLDCGYNPLGIIPALPNNIAYFTCDSNLLTSLPTLPNTLINLSCRGNALVSLPTLPNNLSNLFCNNNKLASLPTLPNSIDTFDCSVNPNLLCLPPLPSNLLYFSCANTGVNCLPNIPTGISTTLPICNATNNPNNCTIYPPNYVNIPDTSFGNFLLTKYPSCLYKDASNKYWMDTTCNAVVSEDSLNCGWAFNAVDLTGVQYFKGLTYLLCGANGLKKTLPTLPNSLKLLDCDANQLTSLPTLPSSLLALYCQNNRLTSLPALPSGLSYLKCSHNLLTTLPTLPNSLRVGIWCDNNLLTALPALPNKMRLLICSNNLLTSLPALPDSLVNLYCDYNQLTTLPTTLSSCSNLWILICNGNQLATLPALPNKLRQLDCQYNQLTSLPALPDTLLTLDCKYNKLTTLPTSLNLVLELHCENNQLTSLPALSNTYLQTLSCGGNYIQCLPKLPKTLVYLYLDSSKVKCLPNFIYGLNVYDTSFNPINNYPFCNPTNNVNQCQAYPVVYGKVFTDNNSNGVKDANEFYRPFVKVFANSGDTSFSGLQGQYALSLDSVGSYTLKAEAPVFYKAVPDSNNFSFTATNTALTLPDIALQPIVSKDSLSAVVTTMRRFAVPGLSIAYSVAYGNVGTTNLKPTVSFNFDSSRLVYDSCSVAIIGNSGDVITVSYDSLIAGQGKYFNIYFTVKPTAVMGDSLAALVTVIAPTTTATANNIFAINSSYDPNDKQATPALTPSQVANGEFIDYTIRFQNTGTATATNIVLADTLSNLLQSNILQVVTTSHNCTINISNNVLYFQFFNINLPDSNHNKQLSNGFVRFRLKPIAGVALGTVIPNKASIYFDYNSGVATNTANTIIKNIVTPVKLLSYAIRQAQVDKKEVLNEWSTATEINLSHFNIQRSTTGNDFKTIGQVAAKGNGSYEFPDSHPVEGLGTVLFYRLMIVDKDGSFTYSPIKQIRLNEFTNKLINVYPNPAKDFVSIDGKNMKQIRIVNQLGIAVYQLNNVTEHQAISTQQFSKGIYVVQVVLNDGSVVNEKLIVE